jgi:hypothetical protein
VSRAISLHCPAGQQQTQDEAEHHLFLFRQVNHGTAKVTDQTPDRNLSATAERRAVAMCSVEMALKKR